MAMTVLGAWSCPSAQTLSVSARELVHLCRFLYEPLPPAALAPGDGPAAKVSVSLRTGNIRAVRERVTAFVREAQDNDFRVVVSAMARIEARGVRVESDRLRWYLSRLKIEPVTEDISSRAIELLCDARLHGHKYAIDAVVAATALRSVRPAIVLTSDEDDMKKLCGKTVQVAPV